jgi:hypothetical protein
MAHWIGWLELVAEQALLVVSLLVAFDGCRRLVRDGMSRRRSMMVALALILPVADASLSMNLVKSVRLLQADKMAALALHGREPAGGWERAPLSPELRSSMSTDAATINYLFDGGRVPVIDEKGARVLFVPTPEQGQQRERFVRDEKAAEDAAQAAYERGLRLFIEAAAFMLAGLFIGWRQRARG